MGKNECKGLKYCAGSKHLKHQGFKTKFIYLFMKYKNVFNEAILTKVKKVLLKCPIYIYTI